MSRIVIVILTYHRHKPTDLQGNVPKMHFFLIWCPVSKSFILFTYFFLLLKPCLFCSSQIYSNVCEAIGPVSPGQITSIQTTIKLKKKTLKPYNAIRPYVLL
jgi:hypothetical protein